MMEYFGIRLAGGGEYTADEEYVLHAPSLMGRAMGRGAHSLLYEHDMLRPAGHGGVFTWDGIENAITQNPLWSKSFQWIDYIMWWRGGARRTAARPAYMDNRVIRLTSPIPFPELARIYSNECSASTQAAVRDLIANRSLALAQTGLCDDPRMPCTREKLEARFQAELSCAPAADAAAAGAVCAWGEQDMCDVLKSSTFDQLLALPLFTDVSDHFAVMSWVMLDPPPARPADHVDLLPPLPLPLPQAGGPLAARVQDLTKVSAIHQGAFENAFAVRRDLSPPPPTWDATKAYLQLRRREDKRSSHRYMRIMTQNLHFRPYDIRGAVDRIRGAWCDPGGSAYNMQEVRACAFVDALANMQPHERPHVVCLQETQHVQANARLQERMSKLYRHHVTSLTPGMDTDDYVPRVGIWSGLQVWTNYEIVLGSCRFRRFTATTLETLTGKTRGKVPSAGADSFVVNKGVLCVTAVKGSQERRRVRFVVTHPSPYVFYEGVAGWATRATNAEQVALTHVAQLEYAAGVIQKWVEDTDGMADPVFIAGDMNINRYATQPETAAERALDTASACCSNEFVRMLRTLQADMPMIVPDANPVRWVATHPDAPEKVKKYLQGAAYKQKG
jgi:hypothetical protein